MESAAGGTRVALVIGNAGYRYGPPLANPVNDGRAIAEAFRRLAFSSVEFCENLGLIELRRALSDFSMLTDTAEMAVVYFAGHGLEVDGQNYLVPVDAELQHPRRVRFETTPLDDVLSVVAGAKLLRLVILDACRDNPFVGRLRGFEGTRSLGGGLSNIEPSSNMLVAYAAKHGTKAKDGRVGSNSPYAEALLEHLESSDLDIRLLFGKVRDTVLRKTQNFQEPHLYGSLGGESIYLKQTPQAVAANARAADAAEAEQHFRELNLTETRDFTLMQAWREQYGSRAPLLNIRLRAREQELRKLEEADWASASAENSAEGYERYLAGWPDGPHDAVAKERLVGLQDDDAWDRARMANSEEALTAYLTAWPDGRHLAQARADAGRLGAVATEQEAAEAWVRIQDSNVLADIDRFLETFPSCAAAPAATALRDRLRNEITEKQAATQPLPLQTAELEAADWERIASGGQRKDFVEFLRKWPNGAHADQAKTKRDALGGAFERFNGAPARNIWAYALVGLATLGFIVFAIAKVAIKPALVIGPVCAWTNWCSVADKPPQCVGVGESWDAIQKRCIAAAPTDVGKVPKPTFADTITQPAFACPIGQYYSFSEKKCTVQMFCPLGQTWNSFVERCLPSTRASDLLPAPPSPTQCPVGQRYSTLAQQCVSSFGLSPGLGR